MRVFPGREFLVTKIWPPRSSIPHICKLINRAQVAEYVLQIEATEIHTAVVFRLDETQARTLRKSGLLNKSDLALVGIQL